MVWASVTNMLQSQIVRSHFFLSDWLYGKNVLTRELEQYF